MGAAILCVGVMVSLHITLLLGRIEAWCTGWGQVVCPKGFPDHSGGFLGVWDGLGTCSGWFSGWPRPLATQAEVLGSGIYLSSIIETL